MSILSVLAAHCLSWDYVISSSKQRKLTIEINLYWVNCITSWYWYTNIWMWTMHFTPWFTHILHQLICHNAPNVPKPTHVNDKHFLARWLFNWLDFTSLLVILLLYLHMDILIIHQAAVRLLKCKQYFFIVIIDV